MNINTSAFGCKNLKTQWSPLWSSSGTWSFKRHQSPAFPRVTDLTQCVETLGVKVVEPLNYRFIAPGCSCRFLTPSGRMFVGRTPLTSSRQQRSGRSSNHHCGLRGARCSPLLDLPGMKSGPWSRLCLHRAVKTGLLCRCFTPHGRFQGQIASISVCV